MARLTHKVWIGIGLASMAGGTTIPVLAQHSRHGVAQPKSEQPEYGTVTPKSGSDKGQLAAPQGGEAYLTDGGPKDTRIRIYRDIALMRGHLLVGAELIELGLWDEALPHFLHPTEELYGQMERYIKLHKVTPFDRQLKALAQTVKAKNKPAYLQAAKTVEERLANALMSFRRFMTVQPFTSYTAQTIVEIAKVVQWEYEAALENGRFSKPVEYQDSRGFVWHTEQLVTRHGEEFGKIDAAALERLKAAIANLKVAWPAPVPPEQPVLEPTALAVKIEELVKAAQRFH